MIEITNYENILSFNILLSKEYIKTKFKDKIALLALEKKKFDFKTFYTSTYLEISTLKYEKYGKFLLIDRDLHTIELEFLQNKFDLIMQKNIIKGEKRTPNHKIIFERKHTLAIEKQFGIIFQWNPKLTMFSKGNINERHRMATIGKEDFNNLNCTIMDMFTGIGYFLVPYLKNNPNATAIATDINENSINALKENIRLNGIKNKVEIYNSDCKDIVQHNTAHRIIMGLIPDCSHRLNSAIKAIKNNGIIHYHTLSKSEYLKIIENISVKENVIFKILKIEKVKEYSPRNQHIVVDIQITKN